MPLTPDPGSFRDPLSRVFESDGSIYRALRGDGATDYTKLEGTSFFSAAIADGRLVATERVESSAADEILADGDWDALLCHERIPFVSYPYEWTFEMLRDAALLQLDLTLAALDEGMVSKDATSYNVQFVGARPTFIDIGSFEVFRDGDPWYGYRQFCQLFLNPLLLEAYRDVPFQPWLRGSIDGIGAIETAAMLRFRDRFRKGVLTHVALQARAERKYADTDRDVKKEIGSAGFKRELILGNLRGLQKTISGLEWRKGDSTWSGYGDRAHYTDEDLAEKERIVAAAVPADCRLAWDIGANDGHFSRLVAKESDYVVAVDIDQLVVDRLYRSLKADGVDNILPVFMNFSDPSPGLGWDGRERPGFKDRADPDLILCLAVIHHVAITDNVPIGRFVQWLADRGAKVVLEFPHVDDQMVQRLLSHKREGLHADYSIETVDAAVRQAFTVVDTEVLPSGTRTLYTLAPR